MQNIEEIYKNHSNAVYKYLFCLTNNEDLSEDLTQETFAIAVKEINKFKGDCKVSVWLCQIAKHLWFKELKKKQKNISIQEIEDLADTQTVEEIFFKKEDKLQIEFYMNLVDELIKKPFHNKTIGLLITKESDVFVVNFVRGDSIIPLDYKLIKSEL